MKFKVCQICSVFDWSSMIFKILIFDGNKHYYEQVIHHWTKFWKVCASQNNRIPLNIKRLWHCAIEKFFEEEENVIITD